MTDTIYNGGLDRMRDWTTGTYKFLLLKGTGYTPDKDHDFVSDLTPGSNEVTVSGYSRQTASTKTRTVDDSLDRITYDCDDVSFGTLVAGETVTGVVLFQFVTNDADSVLIAHFAITPRPTTGIAFIVDIDALGVMYTKQGV